MQFFGPQLETKDERRDGQEGCVDERGIRGVEETTTNTRSAGVGAETNSRIDPRRGT